MRKFIIKNRPKRKYVRRHRKQTSPHFSKSLLSGLIPAAFMILTSFMISIVVNQLSFSLVLQRTKIPMPSIPPIPIAKIMKFSTDTDYLIRIAVTRTFISIGEFIYTILSSLFYSLSSIYSWTTKTTLIISNALSHLYNITIQLLINIIHNLILSLRAILLILGKFLINAYIYIDHSITKISLAISSGIEARIEDLDNKTRPAKSFISKIAKSFQNSANNLIVTAGFMIKILTPPSPNKSSDEHPCPSEAVFVSNKCH